MRILGIIPSRYASTRFPGKPLIDIKGKSMIQRVYEQACKAGIEVIVATDDIRIEDAVKKFGGQVVMTSEKHPSGTDRCAEALELHEKQTGNKYDIIINIQGDEPFIDPKNLELLAVCFLDKDTDIATLIKKIGFEEDIHNPNHVKAVVNCNEFAMYFSRAPIPYNRNQAKNWLNEAVYYKHIGIYAYRSHVLKEITNLTTGMLERVESLEQNRWLENAYRIKTRLVEDEGISIDTPEDLKKIN